MKLLLSVVADNRQFYKSFSRIREIYGEMMSEFSVIVFENPLEGVLSIVFTDSESCEYFECIKNKDDIFQVLVGVSGASESMSISQHIFYSIRKAISSCKLSATDAHKVEALLIKWEPILACGNNL